MRSGTVLLIASCILLLSGGMFEILNEEKLGSFLLIVGILAFFYSLIRIFVIGRKKRMTV
jgi:predicted membrane protein